MAERRKKKNRINDLFFGKQNDKYEILSSAFFDIELIQIFFCKFC